MTTNKPEVFEVYRTRQGTLENVVLLADYEALQAECEKLRKDAAAALSGLPDSLPMEPYQTVDRSSPHYKAGWNACRRAMLAAAPAVQGEPVAWTGWGCQYPGKMPRLYGECRIAELNCDWENGDQLLYFTAAPQPAEQQPDVAQLVEALEACRDELLWMIERHNQQDQSDGSWLYDYQTVEEADASLAAYRKGGDQ